MFAFEPLQTHNPSMLMVFTAGIPQALIAGRMVSCSYKKTIALIITNLAVDFIYTMIEAVCINRFENKISPSLCRQLFLTVEKVEKYCLFALFNHPYPALPLAIHRKGSIAMRLVLALHGMDSRLQRAWGLGLTEIPQRPRAGQAGQHFPDFVQQDRVDIAVRRREMPLHPFRNNWLVSMLVSFIFHYSIGRTLGVKGQHSIALWGFTQILDETSFQLRHIPSDRMLLRGVKDSCIPIALGYAALRLGAADRLLAGMNLVYHWQTLDCCAQMIGRLALASAGYDKYFSPAWQVFRHTEY